MGDSINEQEILKRIRVELSTRADLELRESQKRYFKEAMESYGIKTAEVQRMAKAVLKELKQAKASKDEIFELCEELWKSGMQEEMHIACAFSESQVKLYEPSDFETFGRWIKTYVSNWASCDTLCNHTVGDLIAKFPELSESLIPWTESDNRWVRRAAAVTLIVPAKRGGFLPLVFRIADALLTDTDDMVQKGYGWLLKETAESHEDEVFAYIMAHKAEMPRTALRYAIEKMPQERRQMAMAK